VRQKAFRSESLDRKSGWSMKLIEHFTGSGGRFCFLEHVLTI